MIRALLTCLIEYFLAYLVYKHGSAHKNVVSLLLFFLATYQLGEVIIFATNGNEIGFKVAYASTTLLPPLGVLLLQKITKKQFGYAFFQFVALLFVAYILIIPRVALSFELTPMCVRIYEYDPILTSYWFLYYQGTLVLTMLGIIWSYFRLKDKKLKHELKLFLLAYLSFDGVLITLALIFPWFWASSASLMCALALIAAFILARISMGTQFPDYLRKYSLGVLKN